MAAKRVVAGVVVAMFCSIHALSQVGVWKNYTSMQEVRSLARSGNTFWAATSGGLFSWAEGGTAYVKFTSAEGLQSTDLTAVAIDKNGDVWTGTSTGIIHVYSPAKNSWRYVPDITSTNQTNKRINNILVFGDTLLICTEFGLSAFRNDAFQFGDTYSKFGSLTGSVRVSVSSAAIHGGRIWAVVSDRQNVNAIASASLSNPNLLPPDAWTLQTFGAAAPRHLSVFNSKLYAGTTDGLLVLSGSTWTPIAPFAGKNIVGMTSTQTALLVTDSYQTYSLNSGEAVQAFGTPLPSAASAIAPNTADLPTVGSSSGGILTFTNNAWTPHFPNGPTSNQFISIAADLDGNLWGGTGVNAGGKGFYRFDGTNWKSFNKSNSPLPTNDYWRVSSGCDGSVVLGSWGRGGVLIPRGQDRVDTTYVFGRNKGIRGISNDTNFVVLGSSVCDGRGNTWMSVLIPVNKHVLAARKSDGNWITLPLYIDGIPQDYITEQPVTRSLAVDQFDNLWVTAVIIGRKGVASLNNRGSVTDSVANFLLTSANGLPNDNVNCVVADKDGDIWIGTESGIAIVLDPSNPYRQGGVASYKPLSGLSINAIAVDPLNQKWVATNEGAILLSRDGTQTLAQYNMANTDGKIISNEIKDIAIDAKTGTVFLATTSGLASVTTTAVQPRESFDELSISPNPYRIPSSVPLTVDGLVENSVLKILTIDGKLVRELQTPGGRKGFWNGKDDTGKDVASGVYVVVAYSETNKEKVGKGKVAVLRK